MLQDSLGGNAKTIMVANVGPANYNFDESMTTLRYANRAKNIKNIPKINEDPKDAKMREYKDEIDKLKRQLADRGLGDGAPSGEELMEQAKAQISQAKEMAEAEKIKIMEEAKKKSNGKIAAFRPGMHGLQSVRVGQSIFLSPRFLDEKLFRIEKTKTSTRKNGI